MSDQLVDEVLAVTVRALRDIAEAVKAGVATPAIEITGQAQQGMPTFEPITFEGLARAKDTADRIESAALQSAWLAEHAVGTKTSPGGGEDAADEARSAGTADAAVPSAAGAPAPGDPTSATTSRAAVKRDEGAQFALHRIAGSVLWRHRRNPGAVVGCVCGWEPSVHRTLHEYNAHVVDMLDDAQVLGVAR